MNSALGSACLVVALLVSSCTSRPDGPRAQIRPLEGIFRTKRDSQHDSISHYLRFCTDGIVLGASIDGTPENLPLRFAEENPHIPRGTFVQEGRNVTFTLTAPSGSVDYEGTILGDRLVLKVHSRFNGRRSTEEYFRIEAQTLDQSPEATPDQRPPAVPSPSSGAPQR